jgi:NADH-quinone oxidoreductase subunit M
MANVELIMLMLVFSGILAYGVAKFNATYGSIVVIVASFLSFVFLGYFGYVTGTLDDTVNYLTFTSFNVTELGLFFAVIVTFVFSMVSFFNPFYIDKIKYNGAYSMLYLFALAGAVGVFFTNNMLYLFFFFEFVVWTSLFMIPMGRSKKAPVWYFGFSAFGSFSLLIAVLLIHLVTGSWNIESMATMSSGYNITVFFLLGIAAFAKLGAFPLHYWLPKVLKNAPDPVTAVFSGGLEKLGAFVAVLGLVKLGSSSAMFSINGYINMPYANYFIAILGSITIVVGTLMAIRQDDAKKLLAYSSMSNGGYILVAFAMMNSMSITGGLYHVLAHAIASTAAFLAIGAVHRVTGTTKISELGGLIHKMPITYMVYLIAIISMAGIPPMGGFISKWMIFQSVIDNGLIFIGIATFFGSIGSFLYVFRPLAALFLGQELPEHRDHTKEAPIVMLIPMLLLSALNVYTGVHPKVILDIISGVVTELGHTAISYGNFIIEGNNGNLDAGLIAAVFGIGVFIAFLIFIALKKSKKVGLMDTYTAGNFVYTENLLHYTVDFYAPFERLYEKYTTMMKKFYETLANKVKEFGMFVKYFFFANKPEITVFFIMIVIIALLWGEIV